VRLEEERKERTLNRIYPYNVVSDNGVDMGKSGYHKPDYYCGCSEVTDGGGAYRDERYYFEDPSRHLYYLHQNCIACEKKDKIIIHSCGYRSKTTKDRLNKIIGKFKFRIEQIDFKWYLRDNITGIRREFEDGMILKKKVKKLTDY